MKRFLSAMLVTIAVLALLTGLLSMLARSRFAAAVPVLRGTSPYVVLSGSMEPAVPVGSIVFVRPVDPAEVREGDVITFRSRGKGGHLTTHRVVSVGMQEGRVAFDTKGDANKSADPAPVFADDVVGVKVAHVPYVGRLSVFARSRVGFVLLIVLPALVIISGEIAGVVKEVRDHRARTVTEPVEA